MQAFFGSISHEEKRFIIFAAYANATNLHRHHHHPQQQQLRLKNLFLSGIEHTIPQLKTLN
jgi:hypothetical protein